MRRPCESCLLRRATRMVKVGGVRFLVCTGCAPTLPVRGRRAA